MKKIIAACLTLINFSIHAQFTFTGLDILPGINGVFPRGLVVMNHKIYFSGSNTNLGVSDGTLAGSSVFPIFGQHLTPLRDSLVFMGDDASYGVEPYASDGTPGGTFLLKDINPGPAWSNPGSFVNFNNQYVYFAANSNIYGRELWRTDGTDTGTVLVVDINPGLGDGGVGDISVYNNKLYFAADDGIHGYELWVSDGTAAGTQMVADLAPGPGWSNPSSFKVANNKLYFNSSVGTWVTDGTAAGTDSIHEAGGTKFIEYHGDVFFTNGFNIYKTDGTALGTSLFLDSAYYDTATNFIVFNDHLFFTRNGEPLLSDGTVAGSFILKDINAGSNHSHVRSYRIFNDRLFFVAFEDATNGYNLYVSNGTSSSTHLINSPTTNQPNPIYDSYSFQILDSCLFFMAGYDDIGFELWKICGTDTNFSSVENLSPTEINFFPNPANETIYFQSAEDFQNAEIELYDLNGKILIHQPHLPSKQLDVSTLAPGMYIVEITKENKRSFVRMVKQ